MEHSIQILRDNMTLNLETGHVYWTKTKSGRDLSKPIGHIDNDGYLRVIFNGVRYRLHRFDSEVSAHTAYMAALEM